MRTITRVSATCVVPLLLVSAPSFSANKGTVTTMNDKAFDVEIQGTHPRRLWVDGEPVVTGGLSKEGTASEAKGSVRLEQGTHVVMLETVFEPERGAPWSIGATLTISKPDANGLPLVS